MKQLFLLPFLATALLISCQPKQQEIKPQEKVLTEAVYASGTLVPEVEYKVMTSTEGYIQQALVNEGDTVTNGQSLFTLYSPVKYAQEQAANALLQQTANATHASAPLFQELQQRLDAAAIRASNDSAQYHRYKNLYAAQAVSKATYEQFELRYQSSRKEAAALSSQLQQQHLNARIQLLQASNQRQLSTADASNLQLKSYTQGVVYEVYKQKGDLVTPGQPLALIGSGKTIVKLMVDEEDLSKVQTGQTVLLTIDAFPDKTFKATVQRIYPILNKVEQSFRVDAVLTDALPTSIYGLNVEANIVIKENQKVLVIPEQAVLKGDSVLVKQNDELVKVKIRKGTTDGQWVEVRSGITPSSLLIIQQ